MKVSKAIDSFLNYQQQGESWRGSEIKNPQCARQLVLSDPKSGNQTKIVFIPKKVADRLREYIASVKIRGW